MASIVKRKNKYSVVYLYEDENGNSHQKWESFDSYAAAKKRKIQIEHEKDNNTFIPPSATTVEDLLEEFVAVYGVNKWAISTYERNKSVMYNYIIPMIGDIKLADITPRIMDQFYQSLPQVKVKTVNNRKTKNPYVSASTIRSIHKLLRTAFGQAEKWEMISRNPVIHANLPKQEKSERKIWTAETMVKAFECCESEILALAMNLAFSCSLRVGEMLGLTWDCVEVSEESIRNNRAYIYIDKELQRVNRDSMERLNSKDIKKVFPRILSNGCTKLVLKTPKTATSVRKIFLPATVARMLIKRKNDIDELIRVFGTEYMDNNLVFCHESGRPMESQCINRELKKLIKENDLPKIVFHSFRHASITYKLKWNGGDIKSVQGDSGHARMDMVADVYSHIIDEDRRFNAQKFDEQFYNRKEFENTIVNGDRKELQLDNQDEYESEIESEERKTNNGALIEKLLSNPETAQLLKLLAEKM